MFAPNVGTLDRDIRIVLGVLLGILSLFGPIGFWQLIPAILALVMFVTAAVGTCPIYRFLGVSTARKLDDEAHNRLNFRR
jgi:hypothetical protein